MADAVLRNLPRLGRLLASLCWSIALTRPASAQQSEAPRPEAPAGSGEVGRTEIVLPQLVEFVEAEYPAAAAADGRGGSVVLQLTIDAEGRVTDAEVKEPAGHGFDEAARAAALRFRFQPARRGTTPVPARILYSYDFQAPVPAAETALTAPPAQPVSQPLPQPPPRALPPVPAPEAVEFTVQGVAEIDRVRRSAEAVHVVDTERAQRASADLGEVLARSEGVGVRRGGGLGSGTRFSLNGLTDDQIRFFLDGVPLELAGYPFGIANVPVNLVERVEVYRGVVPVRFGADALGGAVNLVTDDAISGTHGAASYQVGSFGTHRLTLGARTLDRPTGILTRASGFYDYADNDYPIDVEVPDERGRLSPARVHRFHDAYRAAGGNVETGFVNRPWAKRLLLRAFVTDYEKELQHNVVMTIPYGEVRFRETTAGAMLRYQHDLSERIAVDVVAGYTFGLIHFLDAADCVYNWFGQCVRERARAGEIDERPRDQLVWDKSAFGRLNVAAIVSPRHALRLSAAPSYTTRSGDERLQLDPKARDPLTSRRDLVTLVSGVEYELKLGEDRLENLAFAKDYLQFARAQEPLPGGISRERERDTHRLGIGDSLRYRCFDWLYAKASYEWATRLPRADEVFGDAMLIVDNLELEPETSHNANLGVTLDARETASGAWRADLNGFLREADQLIVLLGNDRVFSYQNVFGARSLGAEAAAGWSSPREYLTLDANVTYVDFRNTSSQGTFGDFEGDRIPNRPYLFANGSARAQLSGVAVERDELTLTWTSRYVHEYFRGWESVGQRKFKQVVPAQLLHSLALGYVVRGSPLTLGSTLEVQNLTDEKSFDFFGAERPGRAFYCKTTAEF